MTSESLLGFLPLVSGKSDSVAALKVSVVGYSSSILSKTKQSDFSCSNEIVDDAGRHCYTFVSITGWLCVILKR